MIEQQNLKGLRVKLKGDRGQKQTGIVIGPDLTTTTPDQWTIKADQWPNYGFYSRSRKELEFIEDTSKVE